MIHSEEFIVPIAIAKIIEMTLNSSGVRDIERVFKISKDTVVIFSLPG
jgi:transposase-like protein